MEADFTYFNRRAREERLAAMTAPHPTARQAHFDMADRYTELSDAIQSHQAQFQGTVDAEGRREHLEVSQPPAPDRPAADGRGVAQ